MRTQERRMFLAAWLACTDDVTPSGTDTTTTDTTPATTTDTTPPTTTVTTSNGHTLTVNGGWTDGKHVWADVDPQREIVTGWTGDTDAMASPTEWNSALVPVDHDVTLAPTVVAADWTPDVRQYSLEGRNRTAWIVEAPNSQGVALFFHGAGYSIEQLRSNAGSTIAMQLVRAGWTVVAMQSEAEAASGTGGWSSSLAIGSNTDLRNVQALEQALLADGTAQKGEPFVAVGKSSGGFFANTVGAAGLAEAVVSYCALGTQDANDQTAAPTAWYIAAEDSSTSVTAAQNFQSALQGRGLATDLYVHPTTPLYDQRFERIAGVDAATSLQIATALRDMGAVDATGGWTNTGAAIFGALDLPNGLTPDQSFAVDAEIEIMAADHELYDDVAARMVAWLDATL